MSDRLLETLNILDKLIAFESVSGRPNLDIVGWMSAWLEQHGVQTQLSFDAEGQRANLFATIGPEVSGGVGFSGHTDVVPVEGQSWTMDPFRMTLRDGRAYGRGSVDMKGFIACAMASAPAMAAAPLRRPAHLAITFDEEPGSFGAPILAEQINASGMRPAAIVVGEPTRMEVIAGHKGGHEMRTRFRGLAGHSSDPRRGVSAIHYAARFIEFLRELGEELAERPDPDSPFDPPWSTINVGVIHGGAGRNVIAEDCEIEWEMRTAPPDDGARTMERIEAFARGLEAQMRDAFPAARIETTAEAVYPGLAYDPASSALALIRDIAGREDFAAVPFGTDAGCFHRAGLPSVVFGPGNIAQAHKPDEYIEVSQLAACLDFMDAVQARLCA